MKTLDARLTKLHKLPLQRLGAEEEAGLLTVSLPVPPGAPELTLGDRPTHREALGRWPDTESPRRQLLVADADGGKAPATLTPGQSTAAPATEPPAAEMVLFATCPEPDWAWDRHYLRLTWGGRELGFAMGMNVAGEVHWWEGCRLVVVSESPTCRVVEMGGAIPRDLFGAADLERWPGHENPYLHKHNWLNGLVRARLHANGVCEILAHHINSRYVDDGGALEDCVPVLGIRLPEGASTSGLPMGAFPGDTPRWEAAGVTLNMEEPARLATAEHPGQLSEADGFVAYQPYAGVSLYSGVFGRQRLGTPWLCTPEQRLIPKGIARTLRFTISFNPERPPIVARYLAPAWWYGACQELTPKPYLPVSNTFDSVIEICRDWTRRHILKGGFEDGNLPRAVKKQGEERFETSWEGELPGGMFLAAWQSADPLDYTNALRAAYYFTDVAIDHASKLVRMHGYSPPAISLPMQRVHASVLAWLETGDPFLLNAARAAIDNAYWVHKNSWPRSATGRDACFIRGEVLLYRYLGNRDCLERARDAIADVIACQQPDGSFRDQGGGTGIHGWSAYITKPWMGCMAVGGLIDYLDVRHDDAVLAAVKGYADWLMAERWFHEGAMGWSYKHFCKGTRHQYSPREGGHLTFPSPCLWHLDYLSRILPFAAEQTGDHRYYAAFQESFEATRGNRSGDHSVSQSLQFLTWLRNRLWRAELTADGVVARPQDFGETTPKTATIATPDGPVNVHWQDGQPIAEGPIRFES